MGNTLRDEIDYQLILIKRSIPLHALILVSASIQAISSRLTVRPKNLLVITIW